MQQCMPLSKSEHINVCKIISRAGVMNSQFYYRVGCLTRNDNVTISRIVTTGRAEAALVYVILKTIS